MNSISYFKNFNMGRELEICGEFIYESAREMYALRNLYEHFNIFYIFIILTIDLVYAKKLRFTNLSFTIWYRTSIP